MIQHNWMQRVFKLKLTVGNSAQMNKYTSTEIYLHMHPMFGLGYADI